MSAPGPRPDIESTLVDAFARRHAGQPRSRPSLLDVRRRAHRRATRNAAVRTGAVVAAGAAVVAGGWAVTRRDPPRTAAPAVPASGAAPADGSAEPMVTTLSVEGLWNAVAAQLGATVDDLRRANPAVDFTQAPIAGTPIIVFAHDSVVGSDTTTGPPPTFVNILTTPPTTFVDGLGYDATTTMVVPADGGVTDTAVPTTIRSATTVEGLPAGWTAYPIATGDYLVAIAQRFCTTLDELVVANRWPDGANTGLYPGQLIAVPADAC